MTAFAIVSTLVCATWTDYTRARWPVLIYMSIACIVSSICILVWSSPVGLKFFAYCKITLLPVALFDALYALDLAGASYAGQATTFA
jgi:ACS family pantothenate transporter-like MFS transporter